GDTCDLKLAGVVPQKFLKERQHIQRIFLGQKFNFHLRALTVCQVTYLRPRQISSMLTSAAALSVQKKSGMPRGFHWRCSGRSMFRSAAAEKNNCTASVNR